MALVGLLTIAKLQMMPPLMVLRMLWKCRCVWPLYFCLRCSGADFAVADEDALHLRQLAEACDMRLVSKKKHLDVLVAAVVQLLQADAQKLQQALPQPADAALPVTAARTTGTTATWDDAVIDHERDQEMSEAKMIGAELQPPAKTLEQQAEELVLAYINDAWGVYGDWKEKMETTENVPPLDNLEFWQNHRQRHPVMWRVAQRGLCPLVSSAPAERVFSVCGNLLSTKRCSLNTETLNMLLFVKCNASYGDARTVRDTAVATDRCVGDKNKVARLIL